VRGRGAFQYAAQAAHGVAVGDDAGAVRLDGPATHRAHRLARPYSYRHARHLAALSVTTTNEIVARASTPDAQTSALVARVSRSVAIRSARRRCCTIHISMRFCASLSAYRGAAVLLKLLDVLVAAAQPVRGLVGGFCCAAGFNAHGAERERGTAIEWSAHCLAR
jgi:hypothetical protein